MVCKWSPLSQELASCNWCRIIDELWIGKKFAMLLGWQERTNITSVFLKILTFKFYYINFATPILLLKIALEKKINFNYFDACLNWDQACLFLTKSQLLNCWDTINESFLTVLTQLHGPKRWFHKKKRDLCDKTWLIQTSFYRLHKGLYLV